MLFLIYVYTFIVANVQALTFNTALIGIVEQNNPGLATSREERRDAIINAVASSGADVVCLQEVWHTIITILNVTCIQNCICLICGGKIV